jgi:plastocyanin
MEIRMPRLTSLALVIATRLALAVTAASAGQVRVNLASLSFNPGTASANLGDRIVWIWTSGTHTVTSGDGNTGTPDGIFNSGNLGISSAAYSWKSTVSGSIPYYCIVHGALMLGTLDIADSGTPVSDFRLAEVQFNAAGNLDQIEIVNLGAAGNLGKYRLKIAGVGVQTLQIGVSTDIAVAGGGRIVLHFNASGTNTASDLFFPGIADLPPTGSAALYVPNTVNTALTLADQMIDFVQWGAGGQENQATAVTAGFWSAGAAITNVAAGHSIEFCGQPGQYGAGFWHEISPPNFGSYDNCTTPTFSTTWGRIKTLYR